MDRGNSGFDQRHRMVFSANYELPFGQGRTFSTQHKLLNNIIGGWDSNMIFVKQTGLPFTPTLSSSVANAGASRPDRNKTGDLSNPTIAKWFDTTLGSAASGAAFSTPTIFTYGNSGRNILYGPGRANLDASLFKNFALTEKFKLQFRTEIFNLFNHAQFDIPNNAVGSPSAGIISGIVGTPRQMQFALRLTF